MDNSDPNLLRQEIESVVHETYLSNNNQGKSLEKSINNIDRSQCITTTNKLTIQDTCVVGVQNLDIAGKQGHGVNNSAVVENSVVEVSVEFGNDDPDNMVFIEEKETSNGNHLSDGGFVKSNDKVEESNDDDTLKLDDQVVENVSVLKDTDKVMTELKKSSSSPGEAGKKIRNHYGHDGIIAKSRRLNGDTSSHSVKFALDNDDFARPVTSRRNLSSSSDPGQTTDGDEIEVGVSQQPCECDECLLGAESESVTKPPPLLRKQSSWKKIRNIVHWSPFIQQFKRRKYPWIQLAGHQGNFQAGGPGAILKKFDKQEHRSFNKLMKDVLRSYVPEFRGEEEKNGERYVQLQDLLCEFEAPCVMDIKMGCRTYLEEELSKAREKPTLRKDMYKKMVEVDPSAPTAEENEQKAITKPRYMQWRDEMSSSVEMGFRIEGIRKSDGAQVKNFKTTKEKPSIKRCLKQFVEENPTIINKYLKRLKAIRATQEVSPFFKSHEVIGSSLLFVHDKCGQASIWMIDFGKTVPLPDSVNVTHRNKWIEGNHEDGYLIGIDSLINIFEELNTEFGDSSLKSVNSVETGTTSVDSTTQSDTPGKASEDNITTRDQPKDSSYQNESAV